MKKRNIIVGIVSMLLAISTCYAIYLQNDNRNIEDLVPEKIVIKNNKEINIELKDTLRIIKGGIYHLTETIQDGSIIIDTNANVKLILDNVNITNTKGPAINVLDAKNVVIEAKANTKNTLTDSKLYDNDIYTGCIFSNSNVIFTGMGELFINGNYKNGITSKKHIIVDSANLTVNSINTGIESKNDIRINESLVTILSNKYGIKSLNNKSERNGIISIIDSNLKINSNEIAISSLQKINIKDTNITINSNNIIFNTKKEVLVEDCNVEANFNIIDENKDVLENYKFIDSNILFKLKNKLDIDFDINNKIYTMELKNNKDGNLKIMHDKDEILNYEINKDNRYIILSNEKILKDVKYTIYINNKKIMDLVGE